MNKETPLTRTYKHLTAKYILVADDPKKQEGLQSKLLDAIGGETLEFEEEAPSNSMQRKRYRLSILRGLLYDRIAEAELLRMAPLRETMLIACLVTTITLFSFNYKNFGDVWDAVLHGPQTAEQKAAKTAARDAEKEQLKSLSDRERAYYEKLDSNDKQLFLGFNSQQRNYVMQQNGQ